MTNEENIDEIDYDKLIEYELSCLKDDDIDDENVPDKIFLENNINENDSLEMVLDKISKTHEEFYKMCYENIMHDDTNESDGMSSLDNKDDKINLILQSYNLTYDNFVESLSSMKKDIEEENDVTEIKSGQEELKTDNNLYSTPIQALIDHEKVLQEINEEKWNDYDKFYMNFNDRCQSARSISQKELQEEASIENIRRQALQVNLEKQLKTLEDRMKEDEKENETRLLELDQEIQQEKDMLIKLQNDSSELVTFKQTWAAIMIQKSFRKYRIRKRIGAQIDEARQNARRKLFNSRLIVNEKEAQKQKAAKLRKWRKQQDKEKEIKMNNLEVLNSKTSSEELEKTDRDSLKIEKHIIKKKTIDKKERKLPDIEETILVSHSDESLIEKTSEIGIKEEFEIKDKILSLAGTQFNNNNINVINLQSDVPYLGEPSINKSATKLSVIEDIDLEHKNTESLNDGERINDGQCLKVSENINGETFINRNIISDDTEDKVTEILDKCVKSINENSLNVSLDEIDKSDKSNIVKENSNLILLDNTNDETDKVDQNSRTVPAKEIIVSESVRCERKENVEKELDINLNHIQIHNSIVIEDLQTQIKENEIHDTGLKSFQNKVETVDSEIVKNENQGHQGYLDFTEEYCEIKTDCQNIKIDNSSDFHSKNDTIVGVSNILLGETPGETSSAKIMLKRIEVNLEELEMKEKTPRLYDGANIIDNINEFNQRTEVEETDESINPTDENYVRSILKGNVKLSTVCIEWMAQNIENKTIVPAGEVKQTIPAVPRHLTEQSNLTFLLESHLKNSILMEPEKSPTHLCKSLSLIDAQLSSLLNLKETFPAIENLIINKTPVKSYHSMDISEHIKYLNIDENKIEWAYFGNNILSNLTIVSCSSNELCDLPADAFRNCYNLVSLDLSNNNFLTIESVFGSSEPLKSLCSVNFNNNVLSNLDNLDTYCPNLTHLSLSGNHLKNWPNDNKFLLLIDCDLSHNSLSSLSVWTNNPLLSRLNLSYNSISDMDLFTHSWMPCLSSLVLDSNKLKRVPEFIFPNLQDLSIQRNFVEGISDCETLFQNCPILTFVNLKDNLCSCVSKTRNSRNQILDDVGDSTTDFNLPCPDGEFAIACFDFADSIQQKSIRLMNFLKSQPNAELASKHQFHFHQNTREIAEEFSNWMYSFLFHLNSKTPIQEAVQYSELHSMAAIKIQATWKGYRTFKWYRSILANVSHGFEELGSVDISEFDETELLNNWSHLNDAHKPTKAWLENVSNLEKDILKGSRLPLEPDSDDIIIPGTGSTYRSNSSKASLLNKKEMDIMKEWGFEDPNSALWMMQRAKKFQKKPDKVSKIGNSSTKRQISPSVLKPLQSVIQNWVPNEHKKLQNTQLYPMGVATINTVTLQPPNSAQHSNYRSKINDWIVESSFAPSIQSAEKSSFLPSIESDSQLRKISGTSSRPRSINTKLPSINYVP